MSGVRFSVITFPKLERDREIVAICEQFAPENSLLEPYIPLVPAWTPQQPADLITTVNSISAIRRHLSAFAITCGNWQQSGELLTGELIQGKEEVKNLARTLLGAEPLLLSATARTAIDEYKLIVCRLSEKNNWQPALDALRQSGTTLGVIDAVFLVRLLPDGTTQKVARFPFGVGSVDLYEKLPD